MKRKTHLLRAKRGVSPVISTVILVAVAITVAVAVSYWMGGIAGQYTRFEKLEIDNAYAVRDTVLGQWNVTMSVRNTGSTDSTISAVYINGKPGTEYAVEITDDATDVTVASGAIVTVHVYIDTSLFEAAPTVEIKLHTAAGLDYPQMVTLS
ncbi:DUF4352 domain-containing protein [Candidatus Bathyarchaeota archaeon]|nr:DUF4352 domain-containing protein [Candidatus Bathyarchaeota archaeon]